MKTLIPMVEFVLERQTTFKENFCGLKVYSSRFDQIFNYARFLKQPLELGMFVPCDERGNILEEPALIPSYELEQFSIAKSKVLFEGWKLQDRKRNLGQNVVYNDDFEINLDLLKGYYFVEGGGFGFDLKGNTIESLVDEIKGLIPTETALKQIEI